MKKLKINLLILFISSLILTPFSFAEKYESDLFSIDLNEQTTRGGSKIGEKKFDETMLNFEKQNSFLFETFEKITTSKNKTRGAISRAIYQRYSNSVVLIINTKLKSHGSGSIVNKNSGLILTNWHVVQKASEFGIVFQNNEIKKEDIRLATLVAYDASRDLALLKLKGPVPEKVNEISLSANPISVGEDVHAIGHPGSLSWTYTKGYVSQIRKKYKWKYTNTFHQADIIQTQTPISPGSSGGPLLNNEGKIVGVNSFGKQNGQNLNFAVSSTEILDYLKSYKSGKFKEAMRTDIPSKKKSSKVNKIVKKVDTNNDGIEDTFLIDENKDGKIDTVIKDKDNNGIIDSIVLDTDFDGKLDTVIIDKNQDKKPDLWLFDKNQDGKPDYAGIDTDGDLKPDKYKKIT